MKTSTLLSRTAKAMIVADTCDDAVTVLTQNCPNLSRHIGEVAEQPTAIRLWGRSSNHDELADQTIVDPEILDVLTQLTSVPMEGNNLHAGLQHTYGYLFSLIETPYGFKRDRWISETLDIAFGFAEPTLRAIPTNGTLFFNVTYFLGRIAFQGNRREVTLLRRLKSAVSPSLLEFPYRQLQIARLSETIRIPKNKTDQITLNTDLVRFPTSSISERNPGPNIALLVYSLNDTREKLHQLITAFPVSQQTIDDLISPNSLGKRQPVRLRYNARAASLTNEVMTGSRTLSRQLWPLDEPCPTTRGLVLKSHVSSDRMRKDPP